MRIRPQFKTSLILVLVACVIALGATRIYLQSEYRASVFSGVCLCVVLSTFVMRGIVKKYYEEHTENILANVIRCLRYYSVYLIAFLVVMLIDTASLKQSIPLTFALLLAGLLVIEPARNQLFTKRWLRMMSILWIAIALAYIFIVITYHMEWANVYSIIMGLLVYIVLELLLSWLFRKYALQSYS